MTEKNQQTIPYNNARLIIFFLSNWLNGELKD